VKIPYVACEDIGEFAKLAFENPNDFRGRKLNLIGDFISGDELAAVLSRVSSDRPIRHKAPPIWLMWIFAREWIALRKQFESWGRPPYPEAMLQGIEESRRLHPRRPHPGRKRRSPPPASPRSAPPGARRRHRLGLRRQLGPVPHRAARGDRVERPGCDSELSGSFTE
jgi:hypothetical protein